MTKKAKLAKEQVLKIYEDAQLWTMISTNIRDKYSVEYWSDNSGYIFLSKFNNAEDSAWINAWKNIQQQMLKKLEV